MSRAAYPAPLQKSSSGVQQFISKHFLPQAGENRTQARASNANIESTSSGARGVGNLQTTQSSGKPFQLFVITYNSETMSMDRMTQITHTMRDMNINVACLQGTRWSVDWDLWLNGFRVFNIPAGKASSEAHAGVSIVIDQSLLVRMKVTKHIIMPHRIVNVRIHNMNQDLSFTSAYAPGDHISLAERNLVWEKLNTHLNQIPERIIKIVGIDANGHIGRDTPTPYVESKGSTRWTPNGQNLADIAQSQSMMLTNTLESCRNCTWTWQCRDGRTRNRVDYLMIPSHCISKLM